MRDAAISLRGRGVDLNDAFGLLEPFFVDANEVVRTLDTQGAAVRQLIKNTGVVFNALSERRGQLQSLILNTERVFSVTAQRDADLQALFTVFPTFLDESSQTLLRLDEFAANTDPLVQQLRPAIRELSPTLISTANFAPYLRTFLRGLDPVIDAAPDGLPSLRQFLREDAPPLLGALEPFTRDLDPLLQNVSLYRREIAAFLGNGAATTNADRQLAGDRRVALPLPAHRRCPLGPDSLAGLSAAPALQPRQPLHASPAATARLGNGGLESFEVRHCSSGINAILRDWDGLTPAEQAGLRGLHRARRGALHAPEALCVRRPGHHEPAADASVHRSGAAPPARTTRSVRRPAISTFSGRRRVERNFCLHCGVCSNNALIRSGRER